MINTIPSGDTMQIYVHNVAKNFIALPNTFTKLLSKQIIIAIIKDTFAHGTASELTVKPALTAEAV